MDLSNVNPKRRVLHVAVASLLNEASFDAVDKDVLDTLTEMLQCCMLKIVEYITLLIQLNGLNFSSSRIG